MGCRRGWFLDRGGRSSPRNCVPYCVTGLRPHGVECLRLRQTTRQEEMPGRDARLPEWEPCVWCVARRATVEAKVRLKGRPASRSYATERMTRVVRVSVRCKSGFIPCSSAASRPPGRGPNRGTCVYDLGQGAAAATGKTQAADTRRRRVSAAPQQETRCPAAPAK